MTRRGTRIRHQLSIHVDYFPGQELDIVYSYPYSVPPLEERKIHLLSDEVPNEVRVELDFLSNSLEARIPAPRPVRLPHAKVPQKIIRGVATMLIQDQDREIPIARLYYYEKAEGLESRSKEQQVRMEPGDFSPEERESWCRLKQCIKGMAWEAYKQITGAYHFP